MLWYFGHGSTVPPARCSTLLLGTRRSRTHVRPLHGPVRLPATFDGRKFDLRAWAVISSVDPLRILLLRSMFPKVSTVTYNASVAFAGDACMHVRRGVHSSSGVVDSAAAVGAAVRVRPSCGSAGWMRGDSMRVFITDW